MVTLIGAVIIARNVGDHQIGKNVLAAGREPMDENLFTKNVAAALL